MQDRLQQAITVLQTRYGSAAPRPAGPAQPTRSSGVPELDELTGIGGWPVGRLTLLAGPRGSGKRTLAQRSVAVSTLEGATVYVDFASRLDPRFLSGLGADLDRLLVVRPLTLKEGMDSARVLAQAGADLVCLDLPTSLSTGLDAEMPHLLHKASEAACTLLLLQEVEAEEVLRYYASLIVQVRRHAWIFGSDGDLHGMVVEAAVAKNRLAPPGRTARWDLQYPGQRPQ
jgi:recombination protein RecA